MKPTEEQKHKHKEAVTNCAKGVVYFLKNSQPAEWIEKIAKIGTIFARETLTVYGPNFDESAKLLANELSDGLVRSGLDKQLKMNGIKVLFLGVVQGLNDAIAEKSLSAAAAKKVEENFVKTISTVNLKSYEEAWLAQVRAHIETDEFQDSVKRAREGIKRKERDDVDIISEGSKSEASSYLQKFSLRNRSGPSM